MVGAEKEKKKSISNVISSTYIDHIVYVSLPKIVQDRGIVQVRQISHIFGLFKLGRIHLLQKVFFHSSLNIMENWLSTISIAQRWTKHFSLNCDSPAMVLLD